MSWKEQMKSDADAVRGKLALIRQEQENRRQMSSGRSIAGGAAASTAKSVGRILASARAGVAQKLGEEGRAAGATLHQVFDLRLRSGESFLSQPQQAQRHELTQEQNNGRGRSR